MWALIALVVVSTAYLLPFLVGRREMMGLAHAEDRYSAELRVLATGDHSSGSGEACTGGGRAQIFRRRPEVKAMNRPAVRNVRALRTERELARARRVHEEGRRRRAEAASHRGVVASVLLGITLGTLVVATATVLPWWTALLPAILLAGSMAGGRRAAIAAQESDRRERRRIAELRRRMESVVGETSDPAAVERDAERPGRSDGTPKFAPTGRTATRKPVQDGREASPIGQGAGEEEREEIASPITADAVPRETAAPAQESTGSSLAAPALSERSRSRQEGAIDTPPQGWSPVHVPAPTYTLAARAPRRSFSAPEEAAAASVPVPARPQNARSFSASDAGDESAHQMIDLDAVLERRRAVGE